MVQVLAREIERVGRENGLGQHQVLGRLFAYLSEQTLAGRSPKEVEVAIAVFGRDPHFDAGRDSVVRVYVHKLRRKLESLPRGPSGLQLAIPKGEYRLMAVEAPEAPKGPVSNDRRRFLGRAAAVTAIAGGSALVGGLIGRFGLRDSRAKALDALGRTDVWGRLLDNGRPTLLSLGDYYIFGESLDGMFPDRLVREFGVESKADLDQFLLQHPEHDGQYIDMDLRYLPVGAGYALAAVTPLFRGTQPRFLVASDIATSMLKGLNVVYIGYLSGMGSLKNAAFAGSRFAIGESYDELVDRRTGQRYLGEGGSQRPDRGSAYRDYAYFSTFAGPGGGRFISVSGMRDAGLRQMADIAMSYDAVRDMERAVGRADAYEALYVVDGVGETNVAGKRIFAGPIDQSKVWDGAHSSNSPFPAG